jgi:hypothetical protein
MSVTEATLSVIHSRLQELSTEATPEQLAYLAKAFETIASSGKMIDIAHLADQKLDELLGKANEYIAELEADKVAYVGSLESSKDAAIDEILGATSQNVTLLHNLVNTRKPELTGLVAQFEDVNDVPAGSSILAEITKEGERRKFVKDGAFPFVFGILSRNNDYLGIGNFTTELGAWASGTASADVILQLLAGCHDYTTEYGAFYKEPSLCFLQGAAGNFIQKEMHLRAASNASMYQNPYAALGVFFIKNPTNSTIVSSINVGGSSYLEGAAVLVGTPDAAEETLVWQNLFAQTSTSNNFAGTTSFAVPAHTTVALLLYTSSFYSSTTSGYYVQFLHWYVHSFRLATLVDGLEIDTEKTLSAWQNKGLSSTYDLWR